MADKPIEKEVVEPSFSQDQVTKMMEDTVKETMAKIKKDEPEDKGIVDDDYRVPQVPEYEVPAPPAYYPEQPADPNVPAQPAYDPRVDELVKEVRQGTIDNANNRFNNGWNELVHERPELAEFTERAHKKLNDMIAEEGKIVKPEIMAHLFMGEKAFSESGPLTPDPNVPASQVPANPSPTEEKPLKEMTDEEFEEWEDSHGNDKI